VDGYDRDGGDRGNNGGEQDDDEPSGAVCGLWRGLGDAHGVDKGVRDELDELHVFPMVNRRNSSRNRSGRNVSVMVESEGFGVHLLSQGV
jgi:hypothetical protein